MTPDADAAPDRASGPGPYAVAERERRFLLADVPPGLPPGTLVEDRYLIGTGLRLRTMTGPDARLVRKLGHKVREGGPGTVWHTSVYPDEVEWRRLAALGGVPLRKRRHRFDGAPGEPPVSVDVFEGALAGLVTAEVDRREGPDRADLTERLRALGLDVVREVTGEEEFTGGVLAARGLPGSPAAAATPAPGLVIRPFAEADWPAFGVVFDEVVRSGETYALPVGADPRTEWVGAHVVVAEDAGGRLLGSAKMGPNRPGPGAHVGTASFMVGSAARGSGVGRALGAHVVAWHREQGFRAIQFNAVVETNTAAVRLWQDLGFAVIGTVPGAFRRPSGDYVGLHVMHLDLGATG